MKIIEMTRADWLAEGKRLFGEDFKKWKFICPVCGNVQCGQDFLDVGCKAAAERVYFSCIGRVITDGRPIGTMMQKQTTVPCDYTGGGLFRLNPIHVTNDEGKVVEVFAFAREAINAAA